MCEEKKCCNGNCGCGGQCNCKPKWTNDEPPFLFNLDGVDDVDCCPDVDDSHLEAVDLGVVCNECGEDKFDEVEYDNYCGCDDGECVCGDECECDCCNCGECGEDKFDEEKLSKETFTFDPNEAVDCCNTIEKEIEAQTLMLADIVAGMLLNTPIEVCFAAKEGVEIPTKRPEDMGFDVKAHFDEHELVIKPHETKLIPTGLYSAVSPCFGLLAREKGSTGAIGMKLGAGVIDSGYRDEIFIAITNENEIPIVITKDETLKKVEVNEDMILYPYKKGIAQLIVTFNPAVEVTELSIDELKAIPSERGEGKLGSTDNL